MIRIGLLRRSVVMRPGVHWLLHVIIASLVNMALSLINVIVLTIIHLRSWRHSVSELVVATVLSVRLIGKRHKRSLTRSILLNRNILGRRS
jgi:hypothetical protein